MAVSAASFAIPSRIRCQRRRAPRGDTTMAWKIADTGQSVRTIVALDVGDPPWAAHELATLKSGAERVARLMGWPCHPETSAPPASLACFYIPSATLTARQASSLAISGEWHLWGGVVPHAFVATKLVSHPLWSTESAAPEGWKAVDGIDSWTLPGYSVFSREDARAAGRALLDAGRVRVKSPHACGGEDQFVLEDTTALRAWLDRTDPAAFEAGFVLERDLDDAVTYSVGSSDLCGRQIAYHGRQREVRDRAGNLVYGGSRLFVCRGGMPGLRAALPAGDVSDAVGLAIAYDHAVRGTYGVLASRLNYDVIAGNDRNGRRCIGVLEQSWRFGGASMAEILAMEYLQAFPDAESVVAETVETYEQGAIPEEAVIHWHGDSASPRKFARILNHGR
jgi:hypothetical protein